MTASLRRYAALAGLVGVALAGCDESPLLGPDASQGIEGIVMIGPQCPVQTAENPCPDLPFQAWIAVEDSGGSLRGRVQSSTDGRFRIGLLPGDYTLVPEAGIPFPTAGEQRVRVGEGVFTTVTINYDTGIR